MNHEQAERLIAALERIADALDQRTARQKEDAAAQRSMDVLKEAIERRSRV